MFFFCLRFKNNRRPTVFLFSIFENAPKKVIHSQKRPKWRFWRFDGMMWKLLVYLLVWCGSCMAPAAPPGSSLPSRVYSRSRAHEKGYGRAEIIQASIVFFVLQMCKDYYFFSPQFKNLICRILFYPDRITFEKCIFISKYLFFILNVRAGNLLICSSLNRSFAHFAQIKWGTVSDSLRSLKTNEWPWANRSGRSEEMSNLERFTQVAQRKWAMWVNRWFHSRKMSEWVIHSKNFG